MKRYANCKSFEEMLNASINADAITKSYETITIKIDGDAVFGNIMSKDEFIRTFHELETLMCSDDKKYWVLYEEHAPETPEYYEVFWCLPITQAEFWNIGGEWHHVKTDSDILSDILDTVTGVTLDEDEYEFELESLESVETLTEYEEKLVMFDAFELSIIHYILYDARADEDVFRLWKSIEQSIAIATSDDIMSDNKVCVITWLEQNWGAYLECILDGKFRYMNVTSLVLDSWKKFCEEV